MKEIVMLELAERMGYDSLESFHADWNELTDTERDQIIADFAANVMA